MNSTSLSYNETTNSTLSLSDNLNFIEIITNPYFYGSSIIFIILLSCIITFIFILKSKPKLLLAKPA